MKLSIRRLDGNFSYRLIFNLEYIILFTIPRSISYPYNIVSNKNADSLFSFNFNFNFNFDTTFFVFIVLFQLYHDTNSYDISAIAIVVLEIIAYQNYKRKGKEMGIILRLRGVRIDLCIRH